MYYNCKKLEATIGIRKEYVAVAKYVTYTKEG